MRTPISEAELEVRSAAFLQETMADKAALLPRSNNYLLCIRTD